MNKYIQQSKENTHPQKEESWGRENWKDDELDFIWHHALKLVHQDKMDVYEALSVIEEQMASAIRHSTHSLLQEVEEKIRKLNPTFAHKEVAPWTKEKAIAFDRGYQQAKNDVLKELKGERV